MQIKNKYYKCTQYTCIVDTHRIYIIIYRNTRLKYLLLVFQSISADLLNEIKAFGDIASQQRARLEVSKTLLSESNRSLKVTFYLLFLQPLGNPGNDERPQGGTRTNGSRKGELFL